MPCYDSRDHDGGAYEMGLRQEREAQLCAILGAMTPDEYKRILDRVVWSEAGVSRRVLETWWQDHREADRNRRHQESLRKEALAKLSPAERKALGLKEK